MTFNGNFVNLHKLIGGNWYTRSSKKHPDTQL